MKSNRTKKTRSKTRLVKVVLSAYARALTYRDVVVEVPAHWTDEEIRHHLDGEKVNDALPVGEGDWSDPDVLDADINEVRLQWIEETEDVASLRWSPKESKLENLS